jgi:outer membrane protein TolC
MQLKISILLILLSGSLFLKAQEANKRLTLQEVIELAKEQSPSAIQAKHQFLSGFWEYKSYKASRLPHLSLNTNLVTWEKSITKYTNSDGSITYVPTNNLSADGSMRLNQKVGLLGTDIYIESGVGGVKDYLQDSFQTSYLTNPIRIGISQPVFQFNSYYWEKKIEPIKYEEAQREYLSQVEVISANAVNYFYDLALAQLNLEIAEANFHNNDTIYKIALGRYNIGTIAENDVLQIELAYLNSKSDLAQSKINLQISRNRLRSFLGFNDLVRIELVIPDQVDVFDVPVDEALSRAKENSGNLLTLQRQITEAERDVAQARAENRFTANLNASFGLNGNNYELQKAYNDPGDQLHVNFGVQIPILDWGEGRGKYKMAMSRQEVVRTQNEQAAIDFEQQVMLKVMQFNEQDNQVMIAAKSDTVACKRYEVAKQRFLIGKISILDLNVASTEKDAALRGYIQAQQSYWNYYFSIRQYTLFDFLKNEPLKADFGELVK